MQQLGTERRFVEDQYSDSARLRIRIETHQRYSHGDTDKLVSASLDALDLRAGLSVLDLGCGPGSWFQQLHAAGARITGLDLMPGMLREAHQAATNAAIPTRLLQADLQSLPLRDNSFQRVLCAGVLYHVPDVERALRELRRVLAPGGRAVISTNGAYTMRRLYELHADVARELGYASLPISPGHFTLDDMPLVERVFPNAQRTVLEGALVFPSVEPALRFYASNRIDALLHRPADNSHRPQFLALIRERIAAIIDREGSFSVPKSVGFFQVQ